MRLSSRILSGGVGVLSWWLAGQAAQVAGRLRAVDATSGEGFSTLPLLELAWWAAVVVALGIGLVAFLAALRPSSESPGGASRIALGLLVMFCGALFLPFPFVRDASLPLLGAGLAIVVWGAAGMARPPAWEDDPSIDDALQAVEPDPSAPLMDPARSALPWENH
ncbi:MAG: hypothetical protein ACYDBQ_06910 [Thermoplasmatota archaeon]